MCNALLGLHTLTDCDSTSAFKRRGKKAGLQLLQSDSKFCVALARLGHLFSVPDDLFQLCEAFVCQLYGSKSEDVNKCQYELFSVKSAQGKSLPPMQDALRKHVQRANYQAGVWSRALQAKPDIPSPCDHGWELVDGKLSIQWMMQKPAPDNLLVLINCHCQTGCGSARCLCAREGMQCTDACSCADCENQYTSCTLEMDSEESDHEDTYF